MSAKDHYRIADAQLRKRLRSKIKKKAKFCYVTGNLVYLSDGECNIEDCNRRGSSNCLEAVKHE